jgi:hypothetical protein
MTDKYHEDKDSISFKLEELSPVDELYENQPTDNQCISMKEDNYTKQYESLCPISTVHTQEYSSLDNITQSNNDSVGLPFNPKEWLINDSITGKLRPPRQNEFLYHLLEDSRYSSYLCWLDRNQGLFKIHEPDQVTTLWTKVKNRQTTGIMDYDTFARGIRYYYKSGSMMKTHKKYTFRFKMSMNIIS